MIVKMIANSVDIHYASYLILHWYYMVYVWENLFTIVLELEKWLSEISK